MVKNLRKTWPHTWNFSAVLLPITRTIWSNMYGPREGHPEWSKSDREGEISYDIPYMWNLKRNDTNALTKQKETRRFRKQTHGCQGEGIVKDFGKVMYTLLCLKWITNKNLFYGKHKELCSVLHESLDGSRVWQRMDTWICMAESLRCSSETITTLLIDYTPISIEKIQFKKV